MSPPIPNFLIIGAQKSGTTSLHAYLKAHPSIFMSTPLK
ncbi:MAG: sulfotransferase, partial [Pseudomonadota bacterium]|nr:sulfotransferase [Pseudomonadota bacterium]